MSPEQPHLASTHEQYPEGFPARPNDDLLGHWTTPQGIVVVENHPHGYEIHFGPCYDFDGCDGCAPDRGPANPHTTDGHHFRECSSPNRGAIITVAGDKDRSVLEYLAREGSAPHVGEFALLLEKEADAEAARREAEREEHERTIAEEASYAPSIEERLAAAEAELVELRKHVRGGE